MFRSREYSTERREALMRELAHIELRTSRVAHRLRAGEYQSALKGRGFEFVEHRRYVAGDDYRRIDWNVLARTQETYLKVRREEKEMAALIVADLSRSMDLGSGEASKFDVLAKAVATLAFSAVASRMSVGLIAGTDRVEIELVPRRARARPREILDALLKFQPLKSSRTDLRALLKRAHESSKHPSLVFLISDFIVDDRILEDPLLVRIGACHDLVPILIEDKLERALPALQSSIRLRDLEDGSQMRVSLSELNCRKILEHAEQRREKVRKSFFRLGVRPLMLNTERACMWPLMEIFLGKRSVR